MKKRTLGRIAAIGLAGLTAIPAVAIAASADISINDSVKDKETNLPIMSGTAYKFSWQIRKINYAFSLTSATNVLIQNQTVTEPTESDFVGTTRTPLKAVKYYGYSVNASSLLDTTKANVENENAIFNKTLAQWQAYEYYMQNGAATPGKEVPAKKLADGTSVRYYWNGQAGQWESDATGTWALYAPAPGNPAAVKYEYVAQPTRTEIGVATLASEIGTKYVTYDTSNEIKKSENGVSGANYVLGSTTSATTDPTITGSTIVPAGYRYASALSYTCDGVVWYPNLAALYAARGAGANYYTKSPTYAYSSARCYFDPTDGNYYTATEVTNYLRTSAVYVTGTAAATTENAVYRVNGLYYYTWSSAYAAAGYNANLVTYDHSYTTTGNFFSRYTGQFYSTYSAALNASRNNSSYVIALNSSASTSTDYLDPYYLYFMNMGGTSSNKNSLGGSAVKIGNKSGWSNVRSQIRSAKSGATLNVSLNGEVSIPEEILTALDGKNVNVNFTLKNGAVISMNGQDISSPKDINVAVTYNTKNVPSGLVKKATSVNNSLSTSQISISSNTFGGQVGVTVKYSTNRAGCTAKIYRYNSSRNSLQLVDKSTVGSNGKVKFDGMTQGGDFVIVLFED